MTDQSDPTGFGLTLLVSLAISFYVFMGILLIAKFCTICCYEFNRMLHNEDDQSAHFEDPSTRGAIRNAVPEVRLDINDELDAVDDKLHNFVLPENVKEQIYERSKFKNENAHDCVICLEEYKEKETIRAVEPCNHLYHTYCIKKWLFNNNGSCPMCRDHILD